MTPPLVLLDPPRERFWPLAETRPVADIFAGTRSFLARWAARHGPVAALACDSAVAGAPDPSGTPRNVWPESSGGYRVALSTWVPPAGLQFGSEPVELQCAGMPVGWVLSPDDARAFAGTPAKAMPRLPAREAGGRWLDSIWSVMSEVPVLIADDAADFPSADTVRGVDPFVLLGEHDALRVGRDVAIGPFVVLDTRSGPIVLDEEARVEPHAVLRGPLYVGRGSVVLGGLVTASSIGPACKVRGEIEQSIFQGYANKAHEGFVGHSVVGEWVNLGAGTTTSDLKNTYGAVRLEGPDGEVDTGLVKVGAFLGDHVKTGIGTLLTTGARVGVGSNVFGGGVTPRWLPSFSWHHGGDRTLVRWESFARTAEIVMGRRDRTMAAGERELLAALHGASREA